MMEVTDILPQVKKDIEAFYESNPDGVVVIRWATATGKSKLSILLSEYFPLEVISADSRQIFRYMDIGTDKVSAHIRAEIPHHQIDIVDPDQLYTAGQRRNETELLIGDILRRNKKPFIVWGTGLYIDMIYKNFQMPEVEPDFPLREKWYAEEEKEPGTLWKKLYAVDPEEAAKHHPNSVRYIVRALEIHEKTGITKTDAAKELPVKQPLLMIGLWREKDDSNRRINARIKEMLKTGLIEEVQSLLDKGYTLEHQAMNGIGYKETVSFLEGQYDKEKLEEELKRNTHYFAKKQRTRFRRYILDANAQQKENVTYKLYQLSE